ncbi:Dbl homology domain-containing protein [Obelidium mucronatum]|nr:Dbl homology domain-containing protein [Obelidium mucronatum]
MEVGSIPDELLDPPLLRSPLYSADAMVTLDFFLMDAVSGSIPLDAWDWNSTAISWIANPKFGKDQTADPNQHIFEHPTGSKRGYTVVEILTAERNYHQELSIIKNVIQGKLKEMKILGDYAMNKIFDGMDELHDLHLKILARMEHICSIDNWNHNESKISEVFLEFKDELQECYILYINNRKLSEETMLESQNTNDAFKNFLIQCTKSRETKFTEFKDLLLRPFQKLTRYPLLLKELNNRTPETHPEKPVIIEAIETMSNIAMAVNAKMDSITSTVLLFQAQRETKDCPPTFITNTRKCILAIDAMDGRNARYKLFLCNDLLMVTMYEGKKGGLFARTPTVNTAPGGVGGQVAPVCKFVRFIDLLDIEFLEDLTNKMFPPSPNSQSTITSATGSVLPLTVELRIDSQVIGNAKHRSTFVAAFQNEIKRARIARDAAATG